MYPAYTDIQIHPLPGLCYPELWSTATSFVPSLGNIRRWVEEYYTLVQNTASYIHIYSFGLGGIEDWKGPKISNLPNHAHVVSIRDYLMNLSKELHNKIESKVTTSIYQVQNLLVCAVQ